MPHAKTQRRKGVGTALRAVRMCVPAFFAPLRLCVRFFLCLLAAGIMTGCIPASVPRTPGVSGHVYDARTMKPVAGAVVTFENDRKVATKTNAKGAFELPPHQKFGLKPILPFDELPCRTLILVMHEGYHDYSSWVWLIKPTNGMRLALESQASPHSN